MITTTTRAGAAKTRPRRRRSALLWAVHGLLAAALLAAAMPKLAGAPSAVAMFSRIGAGQWLRYLTGTAELAGVAGLLIPRLAGLAAAGLAADMAGATIINAAVLRSTAVVMTVLLPAVCGVLAHRLDAAEASAEVELPYVRDKKIINPNLKCPFTGSCRVRRRCHPCAYLSSRM